MDAMILAAETDGQEALERLMTEINGQPLYRHMLEIMTSLQLAGKINKVVVVSPFPEIAAAIKAEYPTVSVQVNHEAELGRAQAMRLGITQLATLYERDNHQQVLDTKQRNNELAQELHLYGSSNKGISIPVMQESEACIFATMDQPFITANTVQCLIETWMMNSHFALTHIAACAAGESVSGPVIFSEIYYPELFRLHGDKDAVYFAKMNLEDTELFDAPFQELQTLGGIR